MVHVNVQISLYLMIIKCAVSKSAIIISNDFNSMNLVDPCPSQIPNPARIRYPGNCQRFIDCQQK